MIQAAANTPGIKAIDASSSIMQLRGNPLNPKHFETGSPLQQAWRAMLATAPRAALTGAPDPLRVKSAIEAEVDSWEQVPDYFHGAMKRKMWKAVVAALPSPLEKAPEELPCANCRFPEGCKRHGSCRIQHEERGDPASTLSTVTQGASNTTAASRHPKGER
jgi:hypothetical protein